MKQMMKILGEATPRKVIKRNKHEVREMLRNYCIVQIHSDLASLLQ